MKNLVGVLLLVLGVGCGQQSVASTPASTDEPATTKPVPELAVPGIETVREYTAQFYNGELESLFLKFSDEMQSVVPLDQLTGLHENVKAQYGEEVSVVHEDVQLKGDKRGFVRWANFDKTKEIIEVVWILNEDDTIAGFFIRPAKRPTGSPARR